MDQKPLCTVLFLSVDEVLNGPKATVYYAIQTAEPDDQGKDYTKDEVEDMMRSEAYQRKIATCHL